MNCSEEIITDGKPFVDGDAIVIPEGIVEVAADAFDGTGATSVTLPSTLRRIGDRAFAVGRIYTEHGKVCFAGPRCVVVPKGVEEIGYGAFYGADRVIVYDTINQSASYHLDRANGVTDATVGWLGIRPHPDYLLCAAGPNSLLRDFEVEVRSAETDEVKFRVFMPVGSTKRPVACTYVSSWGPCATFKFVNVDGLFESLPNKAVKLKTALDRLMWQVDLDPERKGVFEAYVRRYAKDSARLLVESETAEATRLLESMSLIKKSSVVELVAYARTRNASSEMVAYLDGLAKDLGVSKKRGEQSRAGEKAPRVKTPTPKQVVREVEESLTWGRTTSIDSLGPVSGRINPVDAVRLLEKASVNCDASAVERLFAIFGDFEFKTNALMGALLHGKVDVAQALLEHGADFRGELAPGFVKQDNETESARRRKEYSHNGLNDYSSVGSWTASRGTSGSLWGGNRTKFVESVRRLADLSAVDDEALIELVVSSVKGGKADLLDALEGSLRENRDAILAKAGAEAQLG
ncbi:MAG: hypothetical protein J6D54_01720 [Olsenella sp.]|nr:hypothetical protein [Olsenella sp.]